MVYISESYQKALEFTEWNPDKGAERITLIYLKL